MTVYVVSSTKVEYKKHRYSSYNTALESRKRVESRSPHAARRCLVTRQFTCAHTSNVATAPVGGQWQEPDTAEKVAEEAVLLHAHQPSRW